jgi:hypothetical protein
MAELGIISAKGRNGTAELLEIIADEQDDRIPAAARFSLDVLGRQYAAVCWQSINPTSRSANCRPASLPCPRAFEMTTIGAENPTRSVRMRAIIVLLSAVCSGAPTRGRC